MRLGGPVQFCWMYPIERCLCRLKSYVHNKAYPEGSIAKGYFAEEALTFYGKTHQLKMWKKLLNQCLEKKSLVGFVVMAGL